MTKATCKWPMFRGPQHPDDECGASIRFFIEPLTKHGGRGPTVAVCARHLTSALIRKDRHYRVARVA